MLLTFASVLIESSNPATVVDERAVIEEEGGGTVGESPVVEVIQPAVVLGSIRRPQVEVGSAEELGLNLTGSLAGGRTVGLVISIIIYPYQLSLTISSLSV